MTDKLLWRGDCMEFMPRLPTNSTRLILRLPRKDFKKTLDNGFS